MTDQKPLLKMPNLCAGYGESQALHGMVLEVSDGEVDILLGRNGARKSATLRAIIPSCGVDVDAILIPFPNRQERWTNPGTKLSGGAQQMLAIARILRTGAKVYGWTGRPRGWCRHHHANRRIVTLCTNMAA